jgi:NAD(P)H-dependent FMN reductase
MDLPMLAEPSPAAFGGYALTHTREWSRLINGFDGYVLVSPEYNVGCSCSRLPFCRGLSTVEVDL